jgi:hypothetical protein
VEAAQVTVRSDPEWRSKYFLCLVMWPSRRRCPLESSNCSRSTIISIAAFPHLTVVRIGRIGQLNRDALWRDTHNQG